MKHARVIVVICGLAASIAVSRSFDLLPIAHGASCGNPNDLSPDDDALQACLDRGGIIELEAGFPGYIVNGLHDDQNRGLWLTQSGTILRSKSKGAKATILAGRDLWGGILQTPAGRDVNGFIIEGIDFNGLVDAMAEDGPYRRHRDECADQTAGNVSLRGRGFVFRNNAVQNAMCGTGLGLYGSFDVRQNYIASNGRDMFAEEGGTPWSDGISVLYCEEGYIGSNFLIDNTDIDLALGGGHGCVVEFNTIAHFSKFGVSGLNVGNFDGPGGGDHTDSEYRYNTIYAVAPNRLGMGISVGSHMWDAEKSVYSAGKVFGNSAYGANINLVVDGVFGGEISENALHDPSRDGAERQCGHVGFDYTVFPPHVVDTMVQDGWIELRYDSDWCGDDNAASGIRSAHAGLLHRTQHSSYFAAKRKAHRAGR